VLAAAPRASGRGPVVAVDAAAAARVRRAATATARVAPERTAAPAARLQLDAAIGLAAAASAASAVAERDERLAVAVAAATQAASQAAADRARVQTLEADVARLSAQEQAAKQALAAVEARAKVAEDARYANPLVYGLAWLAALLAAALAWLVWRRSWVSGAPPWWAAPAATAEPASRPARIVAPPAPVVPMPALAGEPDATPDARVDTSPGVMDERPTMPVYDDEPPRVAPMTVFPVTAQHADPEHELSVDELIDLEQQADFFVALDQDEAAIELLMSHVRSSGGASPLPYLKLLEIYKRRGEAEPYERIRERFNRRFNAYAPDWSADLQQGDGLDDHPQMLLRLQANWRDPHRVMAMLDASMLRRDPSARPFDLPACREMLLLYSVARDLSEHEAHGGLVDLLLPLGETQPASMLATQPLDLDISAPPASPSRFSGLIDITLQSTGTTRY